MSGGVDSSLVAHILKDEGHEIFGLTMKQLNSSDEEKQNRPCCSLEDILDAKKICNSLGIAHYTINLKDLFKKKIIDYFVEEYKKGNTPNPCVKCNREVKMGELLNYAKSLGADYLASGHYAITLGSELYSAKDDWKDQSYFLSQMRKEDLSRLILPLGKFTKSETRALAEKLGILTKDKVDSQGVCFIQKDYKTFLEKVLNNESKAEGNVIDIQGNIIGRHKGVHNYTIGQRKGIGIPAEQAYYIIKIDPINNLISVGKEEELYTQKMIMKDLNFLYDLEDKIYYIKTRARDIKNIGRVELNNNKAIITFDEKVRAVTSGQVGVVYDEQERVILSGIIE